MCVGKGSISEKIDQKEKRSTACEIRTECISNCEVNGFFQTQNEASGRTRRLTGSPLTAKQGCIWFEFYDVRQGHSPEGGIVDKVLLYRKERGVRKKPQRVERKNQSRQKSQLKRKRKTIRRRFTWLLLFQPKQFLLLLLLLLLLFQPKQFTVSGTLVVKIQDHLNRFRWLRACGPPTGGLRPGLATAIYYIYMVLGLDVADPMGTPPGYRIGTLCTQSVCLHYQSWQCDVNNSVRL